MGRVLDDEGVPRPRALLLAFLLLPLAVLVAAVTLWSGSAVGVATTDISPAGPSCAYNPPGVSGPPTELGHETTVWFPDPHRVCTGQSGSEVTHWLAGGRGTVLLGSALSALVWLWVTWLVLGRWQAEGVNTEPMESSVS